MDVPLGRYCRSMPSASVAPGDLGWRVQSFWRSPSVALWSSCCWCEGCHRTSFKHVHYGCIHPWLLWSRHKGFGGYCDEGRFQACWQELCAWTRFRISIEVCSCFLIGRVDTCSRVPSEGSPTWFWGTHGYKSRTPQHNNTVRDYFHKTATPNTEHHLKMAKKSNHAAWVMVALRQYFATMDGTKRRGIWSQTSLWCSLLW